MNLAAPRTRLSALAAAACVVTSSFSAATAEAAAAEGIVLEATLRDFNQSHPDMEFPKKNFKHVRGMVADRLGPDGRPVFSESFARNPSKGMVHSAESFDQWFRNVPGVNHTDVFTIDLQPLPGKPGVMFYAREKQNSGPDRSFFPADGKGFNEMRDAGRGLHNYHFTVEIETEFTYSDPASRDQALEFAFSGDDDVWVYINDHLAVDLGGVHGQISGQVNLDDKADRLGLEPGKTYPLKLFFAERHTTESNFRIETTLKLRGLPPSVITANFD